MSSKVYESDKCQITIDDQGIVRWVYRDRVELSEHDARVETTAVREALAGSARLHLVDLSPIRSVERKARTTYGASTMRPVTTALAMLVGSPVSRMLGNFYIGINRPEFPTRLFTDEQAALRWLESMQATRRAS